MCQPDPPPPPDASARRQSPSWSSWLLFNCGWGSHDDDADEPTDFLPPARSANPSSVSRLLRLSCAPSATEEMTQPPPPPPPPPTAPDEDDAGGSPLSARLLRLSCASEEGALTLRPRKSDRGRARSAPVEPVDHGQLEREILRRAQSHAQKFDDPPPSERSVSFELGIETR